MQLVEKWFLVALDISGYKDASVAVMLAVLSATVWVWVWVRPKLQRHIQKKWSTRRKWTVQVPTYVAIVLTSLVLALPTLYYGYKASKLQLEIQDSYIFSTGKDHWALFILANVRNISDVPTVPENFRVRVMDGRTELGPFESLPFSGGGVGLYPGDIPGDKTFYIEGEDFLEKRLVEKPVAPGHPINGWLNFDLFGTRDGKNAKLYLDFQDSFGRNESIALDMPKTIPPIPEARMYRGVKFPFREKKSVPLN